MASRNYTSSANYSFERMAVSLMGSVQQAGSVGAKATLVNNGITWTAVTMGSAGNSITVALVAGGTAGAEVVTVTNQAISVSIESGVSTRTQVLTAVQASAPASALVTISVASGGTAATPLAATNLASGVDTVFTKVGLSSVSIAQLDTGVYQLSLADPYQALLDAQITLQRATAVDLSAQLQSADPTAASKTIVFRMIAGATPTNMANNDKLYIRLELRNSSNQPN